MALSDAENAVYQNILKYVTELSLNLMAVKVTNHPDDFLGWCKELHRICQEDLNLDYLDDHQIPPLKKLESSLEQGISINQLKMARIAPWPIFMSFIEEQSDLHIVEERLRLLDYVHELDLPLAQMNENERLAISGKHTSKHTPAEFNFDVELFASTRGAKVFHTLLAQQPELFDEALSCIPVEGDVTPAQYQLFVAAYSKIFSDHTVDKPQGEKAPLAPATRLLAMKRPDQFIALTNAKIDVLCQGLSIAKFNAFDFNGYWQDMIGTLRTCPWWHEAEPEDEQEAKLWKARVILLDVFLFVEAEFADNSNYLRLLNKSLNKATTASRFSRAKTKLTAEELADKALAEEGIPEYIKGKRATIINEIKNGKTPEQVIGLMRAIFG